MPLTIKSREELHACQIHNIYVKGKAWPTTERGAQRWRGTGTLEARVFLFLFLFLRGFKKLVFICQTSSDYIRFFKKRYINLKKIVFLI